MGRAAQLRGSREVSLNPDFRAVESRDMDPEAYTVDDIARLLHTNLRHVQKLVTMGLLHLDIGGPRGLVSAAELHRFLRANPGWVR